MTEEELSDCLATLLGLNPEGWKSEPAATSTEGTGTGRVRAHRVHTAEARSPALHSGTFIYP